MKNTSSPKAFTLTVTVLALLIILAGGGIYTFLTGQPAWLVSLFSTPKPVVLTPPPSASQQTSQPPFTSITPSEDNLSKEAVTPPPTQSPKDAPSLQEQGETPTATTAEEKNAHEAAEAATRTPEDDTDKLPQDEAEENTAPLAYSTAHPQRGNEVRGIAVPLHEALPANESAQRQDSVVSTAFFRAVATFLASHYWPQGTHPSATYHGITTFTLRGANSHFGTTLPGLHVSHTDGPNDRAQIFSYAFTPSMMRELYSRNVHSFIRALATAAPARPDRANIRYTPAQAAEMLEIYKSKAQAIAGAIAAYSRSPGMPALLVQVDNAWNTTRVANSNYMEAVNEDAPASKLSQLANVYLEASVRWEQARANVASTMRMRCETRGLDTDELLAIARWLHRRGPDSQAAIEEAAKIMLDLSQKLGAAAKNTAASVPAQGTPPAPQVPFALQQEEDALADPPAQNSPAENAQGKTTGQTASE